MKAERVKTERMRMGSMRTHDRRKEDMKTEDLGTKETRTPAAGADYPITPVPPTAVQVQDAFWLPRLETNRTVTIPDVLSKCEESGRVDNFRKASGRLPGTYRGKNPFDDTDVYKAVEGASLSLLQHPDPALESRVEALVEEIAAAQESDGYLYTNRTIDPANVLPVAGAERWSSLVMSHELYNCGHLYEAACAHHAGTGRTSLLEVAIKSARLLQQVFGPGGRHDACGHQIVEMGLAHLTRVTGDPSFLSLARFFLEQRGHHDGRPRYEYEGNPAYAQDHLPVLEQKEAVGHAVRAVYMYCGMADVAAMTPDAAYSAAILDIWRDMLASKIYLTGGIGSRHRGEAFGEPYELPNRTAYCETCASIGSVMWNHRLSLLTGDAGPVDVMEQTLYNRVLAGVSLRGDEYFYVSPLESDGQFGFNEGTPGRRRWFDVSCCPGSLCRCLPSIPGYVYSAAGSDIYANLFVSGRAHLLVGGEPVEIVQETSYPWSGGVRFTLSLQGRRHLRLHVRIPGWARETVLGGPLYRFQRPTAAAPRLRLNGAPVEMVVEQGYAVIERHWSSGDVVDLDLPMPVRKVLCDPRVEDNRGRAAIQRGPVVYCVEERDCTGPLDALALG
ncbi:MAG TPA: beta-L-arabinofuranosidase domain-containing protein, partial [Spirochaetia bacterium]|nr:beta-L-arabinofuranosidase domain-containing protein [Spirochaetia bacterium]